MPRAGTADEAIFLGPWPLGMNNRQPDYALPANSVRNAVNADFDAIGFVRRRAGYQRVYSGLNARAGFSCPAGTFFVEGTVLKRLDDEYSATTVYAGIVGLEVAYCYHNGVVYISDGVQSLKLVDGSIEPWGLSVPPSPTLYTALGSLQPGEYIAAVTRVGQDGVEHGASDTASISLNVAGGIRFSNLPTGTDLRLYLTTANGSTLYRVATVAAGTASYTVSSAGYDSDVVLATQFVEPPPPGRIIQHFNARMYVAARNLLWYTEPYALDRVMPSKNFYAFTDPITVVEPVEAGLIVVADKTYLLRGDGPDKFESETKLPYGAVFGTSCKVPNSNQVMWYSTKGAVVAEQDGTVKNIQEANVAAGTGDSGAAIARDSNGTRQFVASIAGAAVSPLVSSDFFEAEVVRKST